MSNYVNIPLADIINYTSYDPLTGKVTNKNGDELGWSDHGYIRLWLCGKYIYAHQIAFAHMEWNIPNEIDHKDKNGSNNVWKNLRKSNHSQNTSNTFKRKNNKSGFKGVSWARANGCWRMDIQHENYKYHSYHKTAEEAYEEYKRMSLKLHGEFGSHE